MKKYDVIIIGAGAAGLSAAGAALTNGRQVLVLDMGDHPARKVSASGGGRCNFTNMAATHDRYFGQNPDFVRSALAQVKPTDILNWARDHNLSWIEKAPGQFFCATGSADVVSALLDDTNGADIILNTTITDIEKQDSEFIVHGGDSVYCSNAVIIATGGISYPDMTVSDLGYIIAKKFGHKIVPIEPGLVGLKADLFDAELAGISMDVEITVDKKRIMDSLLFTHFGLGGPAAYRASLLDLSKDFHINFCPGVNIYDYLTDAKQTYGKKSVQTLLASYLPTRFVRWLFPEFKYNVADYRDIELAGIAADVNNFFIPGGTLKRRDLKNAEVVMGGVSTEQVSSKTMESKLCPGMFFAGEVLDIAGDLGGFNLHFAFASGRIAGKNV